MSTARIITRVIAGLLLIAAAADGQVRQIQSGRELDANPQVGSAGLNFSRPQPILPNANLYITGNVTRGASFQGFAPVRDFNTINLNLPSDTLSRWRRDSVGITDVTRGQGLFVPQPWFSDNSAVTNVRAIEAGLNRPGSSVPRNPYVVPWEDSQLTQPMQLGRVDEPIDSRLIPFDPLDSQPLTPDQSALNLTAASSRLSSSSLFNFAQPSGGIQSVWSTAAQGVGPVSPLSARGTSMTTAVPGTQWEYRDPLDRRLQLAPTAQLTPLILQPIGQEVPPDAAPIETSLGTLLPGEMQDTRLSLPPIDRAAYQAYAASDIRMVGALPGLADLVYGRGAAEAGQEPGAVAGLPAIDWAARLEQTAGLDVYRELLGAYNVVTQGEHEQPGVQAAPAFTARTPLQGSPERMEALSDEVADRMAAEPAVASGMEREERQRRAADLAQELLAQPVESFAGTSPDNVNRLLADAEDLLRAGEYYRAAAKYEVAAAADPTNPLPLVGRGHALIAAGDYLSAVFWLSKGFERFEGLAGFNLNFPRLIGNPDLADRRRADLENILDVREDYQLRFLLGYVEYYSGVREIGLENLQRAAQDAPAGSIIARFPDLLKAGRKAAVP